MIKQNLQILQNQNDLQESTIFITISLCSLNNGSGLRTPWSPLGTQWQTVSM